jgi:DNA-directed RNA polymerase subunit RPC12/RpoP
MHTKVWPLTGFSMLGNFAIFMESQDDKSSNCPTCGHRMILIKDAPGLGALPALRVYKCQECGVPFAETEEAKGS